LNIFVANIGEDVPFRGSSLYGREEKSWGRAIIELERKIEDTGTLFFGFPLVIA